MKKLRILPCLVLSISFFSLCKAQIAINNTAANPDVSAILDLNSGNTGVNKGFLAPQVALTNVTIAAPVTSPAVGLMVYSSTAPSGGNGTGYYYWNGTSWASLNSSFGGSGTNNFVARWTPNGNTLGTGLIQDNGIGVGVNSSPAGNVMLSVKTTNGAAISGSSTTGTGDSSIGLARGVYGYGNSEGVEGFTQNGFGVYGISLNPGNLPSAGVYGTNNGTQYGTLYGVGVEGYSKNSFGVFGKGESGIYGLGALYGAEGESDSINGTGVYGISRYGVGVFGWGDKKYGVEGTSANGTGVYGTGNTGVLGTGNNTGVYGTGDTGIKGYGLGFTSSNSVGVFGVGSNPTFNDDYGVEGISYDYVGVFGIGVIEGVGGEGNYYGVYGLSTDLGFSGVYGENDVSNGVQGYSLNGTGGLFSGGNYGIIVPSAGGKSGFGTGFPVTCMQVGDGATSGQKLSVNSIDNNNGQFQIGNPNSNAEASMDFISGVTAFGDGPTSTNGDANIWNVGAGNWSLGAGKFSIANKLLGGPVMTFTSAGMVGIGCTTPFYELDVNGNIRASGSVYYGGTACSNAGTAYSKPDFVFEPDYKKTYAPFEIEKFIMANGHLPWVTSAADEKKENNGAIDITRMSFQTLEAVENTQMQIIEQQKTIVSQQAQIDQLKMDNEAAKKQIATLMNSVNQLLNK